MIVDFINKISHSMGKLTIAEFVESQELNEKVKEMGIDYAQGYYYKHPLPLKEALQQGS